MSPSEKLNTFLLPSNQNIGSSPCTVDCLDFIHLKFYFSLLFLSSSGSPTRAVLRIFCYFPPGLFSLLFSPPCFFFFLRHQGCRAPLLFRFASLELRPLRFPTIPFSGRGVPPSRLHCQEKQVVPPIHSTFSSFLFSFHCIGPKPFRCERSIEHPKLAKTGDKKQQKKQTLLLLFRPTASSTKVAPQVD